MTKAINFTKTTLDNLTTKLQGKRTYYSDKQVKGLSFAVQASGAKSFYVVKKIAGKTVKIYLGTYPDLSIENARKMATVTLGQIAIGVNPHTEKQRKRNELTFGQLFDQYMTRYSKPQKKTWRVDESDVKRFCGMWMDRKCSNITRQEIQLLHETVGAENGRYMANSLLRRIRAIFNKGIDWGWQGDNPTKGIKKYREYSRDRFIQPSEMPHLISAINAEESETIRDYFMMLLLTGVRKTNGMTMRWEQINWELAEWRIPMTKNGEALTLPLSEQLIELLRRRRQSALSPFVFPSPFDLQKPLTNVRKSWLEIKERATQSMEEQNSFVSNSLMDVRIHDLRRTFGSYQAIGGASLQVIGKSLGHKCTQATQIYARLNLDAVRASVVKATNAMMSLQ